MIAEPFWNPGENDEVRTSCKKSYRYFAVAQTGESLFVQIIYAEL